MRLSIIAALGRNRVIGVDNAMPWHIPVDLKFFKSRTLGKPVVMGRKTFQSIGKPLPGRPNIVVTRDVGFALEGVTLAADMKQALSAARSVALEIGAEEIMIAGGAEIYEQTIELADRLYLTEIDLAPEGDAYFPDFRAVAEWEAVWREHHPAKSAQPAFDFVIYERT
ncbi:MAG: dihydrofolate reductase [Geminicoccaceae bacterium]